MNEEELNSWKDAKQKMEDNAIDLSNINLLDVVLKTGYIEHYEENTTLLAEILTTTVRKLVKLENPVDPIVFKINKEPLTDVIKNGHVDLSNVKLITVTIES